MADFSVYPNAIDGYAQLPLAVDNVTRVDAVTVNRLRSAIVNIEKELGILPSDTYETVSERISIIEESVNTLTTLVEGIDISNYGYKNPVTVATTGNITSFASGPTTVDGVLLSAGDRVLVHQQTDLSENGIYSVESSGAWVRSDDANSDISLIPGTEVFVIEGDKYGTCKFWLITPGPYTLGVTSLEFVGGIKIMNSDSAPTTILTSTAIGASTPTNSISIRGFNEIDFSFLVTNLGGGPITDIRARVLYSLLESPGDYTLAPEDWNVMLAEDITGGVAIVNPYEISLDPTTVLPSLPASFGFRAPASGLHMMVIISAAAGDPTGSDFTGFALRRV